MLLLSTPFGKRGYFYEMYQLAGRHGDVRAFRFPSSDNRRISREFLDRQRELVPESAYREEHEAEFLDPAGALFSYAAIENAIDYDLTSEPVPHHRYAPTGHQRTAFSRRRMQTCPLFALKAAQGRPPCTILGYQESDSDGNMWHSALLDARFHGHVLARYSCCLILKDTADGILKRHLRHAVLRSTAELVANTLDHVVKLELAEAIHPDFTPQPMKGLSGEEVSRLLPLSACRAYSG